ncbi:response regulator [Pseudomonas sp. RIT-PI-S]|uniref:response regulator n=1 Tax=Pseudomonas sp. RIT-PI-S TaxID=3035295 RepID=UPI0021D9F532|nr:response regulator [Pseudomonas sp. RIT-PI-S]
MKTSGAPWADRIRDLRVLVVEDDTLVGLFLEALFESIGVGQTIEVAHSLDSARWLAQSGTFDVALLDVNLGGVPSFPVAEVLQQRGIPFAFASGFAGDEVQARFPGVPVLAKPFQAAELAAVLGGLLG